MITSHVTFTEALALLLSSTSTITTDRTATALT